MFERFTDRARAMMRLAEQEAKRFNHEYVSTEHLLLALCGQQQPGVGYHALLGAKISPQSVGSYIEQIIPPGPDQLDPNHSFSLTPRSKKVVEYARDEASKMSHNYIGTEHLLLGMLREHDGVAGQVLLHFGATLESARKEILELLGGS